MFSQERSRKFFCDRPNHDQFLARRCLEIMKIQLRFNICQIESSFILDDEILDLEKRVEQNISQELFYSSRFWVDHLSRGRDSSPPAEMVHEFLSRRLLFWMEVLNLKKCMVAGAVASTKAHIWLRNSRAPSDLVALARDAQTFVGNSPTCQIRLNYLPRFTGLVQVKGTLMEKIDQASLAVWTLDYPIRSASFSADRKYIVIGDESGRISVQHSHNGESLITFQAHRKVVSSASFSSDASLIVSSSHDHTICTWKVSDGSLASIPFRGHTDRVNSVAFSPDGMRLLSGSSDLTIRTWNTRGPSDCQSILSGHISAVRSVMFSPDSIQIVSGSDDQTVCIWDASSSMLLRSLRGHTGSIACVRFSPCGTFIVSGSRDTTIRVWDAHNGTPIGDPFGRWGAITSITISPEGERIVSGSDGHKVIVWHRKSKQIMGGPFAGHTGSVRSVEFSADGVRIVSASEDRTVRIWDAQGREGSHSISKPHCQTLDIMLVSISPDGTYIAIGDQQGRIRGWNLQNSTSAQIMDFPSWSFIDTTRLLLITFSSNNASIFAAYEDGVLVIIDGRSGLAIGHHHFSPYQSVISQPLALSSDGKSAISCTENHLYALALWNPQSNQLSCEISTHYDTGLFSEAVFSSNSAWLATGTTHSVIDLWDGRSGQHIAGPFSPGTGAQLRSMDISPNGTRIVLVRSGETPRVYDH
ncbi:hypothetical protein RSAG8_05612, partial [Rhizoctonia solani AG-8 WAC10335]